MNLKTKLSDQELRLLLIALALVMLAASYFLVFSKSVKAAEEIEAQNEIDARRVQELEAMQAHQDEVLAETAAFEQEVADVIEKYPVNVPLAKAIMIIDDMENATNVHISSINLLIDNLIGDVDGSRSGYYDALSMNYEGTYEDVKGMAGYIAGFSDRMTVPTISMSYDTETGNISGTFTVNMYYLTNTDKEYHAPVIEGIDSGVADIFKSGGGKTIVIKEENSDSEENNEEQENPDEGGSSRRRRNNN